MSWAAPAGRTYLPLFSLTAHIRGLLTVEGDELRKDGGNRANRVPRANRTEQPQRLGSESRNPVCGLNSKPFSSGERPCLHPVSLPVSGTAQRLPAVR